MKQKFSSMEHPQTNGQAEAVNRVILRALKRRITMAKTTWPEDIPCILWAYHTTPIVYNIGDTLPFSIWDKCSPSFRTRKSSKRDNHYSRRW